MQVDVLLTCEWPRGITSGVPEGQLPPGIHTDDITGPGPAVIAEIAALARPRCVLMRARAHTHTHTRREREREKKREMRARVHRGTQATASRHAGEELASPRL